MAADTSKAWASKTGALRRETMRVLGLRHMRNDFLFTFGVTENLQNVNNTPAIGFRLGVAFIPRLLKQPR